MGFSELVEKEKENRKTPGYNSAFGSHLIGAEELQYGFKKWPLAGAVAEFEHGANIGGPRVTLTRIALVGIFALRVKKDRNKVYVLIQIADGEQVLIEGKAKKEREARQFVAKINAASAYLEKRNK